MRYSIIYGCIVILLIAGNVSADNLKKSREIITQTNKTLQASQEQIDAADARTMEMLDQYKTVLKEIENYRTYNRQLADIIASQNREMQVLENDIGEIESTGRRIMPLMEKMINGLACFVASDLPFLPEERHTRINTLKDNMKRADLSIAAKYRQILEAFQIEIDYGKTIEAYSGEKDGKRLDYLKIGRLGLYSLSLDKKSCRAWHPGKKQWQPLDDTDITLSIAKAIKIAKKQRAPDLFFAAIPAPGGER